MLGIVDKIADRLSLGLVLCAVVVVVRLRSAVVERQNPLARREDDLLVRAEHRGVLPHHDAALRARRPRRRQYHQEPEDSREGSSSPSHDSSCRPWMWLTKRCRRFARMGPADIRPMRPRSQVHRRTTLRIYDAGIGIYAEPPW